MLVLVKKDERLKILLTLLFTIIIASMTSCGGSAEDKTTTKETSSMTQETGNQTKETTPLTQETIPTTTEVTQPTQEAIPTTTEAIPPTQETIPTTTGETRIYEDSQNGYGWSLEYPKDWVMKPSSNRVQKLSDSDEIIAEFVVDPESCGNEYTSSVSCMENTKLQADQEGYSCDNLTINSYPAIRINMGYNEKWDKEMMMIIIAPDFGNDIYMISLLFNESNDKAIMETMLESMKIFPV